MIKKILLIALVLATVIACGKGDKKEEDLTTQQGIAGIPQPTKGPAPVNFRMMRSYTDYQSSPWSNPERQVETTNVTDNMLVYFDVPGRSCSEMQLVELSNTNPATAEANILGSLPMENAMNCQSLKINASSLGLSRDLRTKYFAIMFREGDNNFLSPSTIKTYTWQPVFGQ